MNTRFILATIVMAFSAGQAFAECEGNGDPFPFQAEAQITSGHPFRTETMASAYPELTGEVTAPSSLAQVEPALSNEAIVQTAQSLPHGLEARANAALRAPEQPRRYLEAGMPRSGR